MTTGVWEIVKGESIIDSTDAPARRMSWSAGVTGWGKPPRDQVARVRRQLLMIVLGWGLAGAGASRALTYAQQMRAAEVAAHDVGGDLPGGTG